MTEDAAHLVKAARDALVLFPLRTIALYPEQVAKITTVAVLRQLALLLDEAEDEGVDDWPDSGDLRLLADDVERQL